MKILSLSDIVIPYIYSPQIRTRFTGIDLVIGCGDLPYEYLEYVVSSLNSPLYFVRGNHDKVEEAGRDGNRSSLLGGVDLHTQVVNFKGVLLAGVEGSLRYREGPFQYSQNEMWANVMKLVPRLLYNRVVHGRYLDIFVTHSPPRGIHDREDLPHQGIDAFRWMIDRFQPAYHVHGHTHIYRPDETPETIVGKTRVVNTYGFRETLYQITSAILPDPGRRR